MSQSDEVTVTFKRDAYNELCNIVQLIAVVGIELYMRGLPQPNKRLMMSAFDSLIEATLPKSKPGQEVDNG